MLITNQTSVQKKFRPSIRAQVPVQESPDSVTLGRDSGISLFRVGCGVTLTGALVSGWGGHQLAQALSPGALRGVGALAGAAVGGGLGVYLGMCSKDKGNAPMLAIPGALFGALAGYCTSGSDGMLTAAMCLAGGIIGGASCFALRNAFD